MNFYGLLPRASAVLTERLGWCAWHFLWQAVAIAAGLWVLLAVCRRGTTELRHSLCGLALLLMAAAPVITWQRFPEQAGRTNSAASFTSPARVQLPDAVKVPGETVPQGAAANGIPGLYNANGQILMEPGEETTGAQQGLGIAVAHPPLWQRWLGCVWMAGAALLGVWRLFGLWGTLRLIRRAERAAGALLDQVWRMAKLCGLRRIPSVRITGRLLSPAVAGVLRPVLLLPASALAGLSPRELDFVLAHEFAHLRRQDFLMGLLQSLVETLLFFHPAVWWVSRRMSFEREQACDDSAMRVTGNAAVGARALARLAELELQQTTAMAPAAGGGQILARVRRLLLEPSRPPRRGYFLLLTPALVVLAALLVPMFFPQRAESQVAPPSPDKPAVAGNEESPEEAKPEPDKNAVVLRGSITDRNGIVMAESVSVSQELTGLSEPVEVRRYPLGASASHTLGYVRKWASAEEALKALPDDEDSAGSKEKQLQMMTQVTKHKANLYALGELSGDQLIEGAASYAIEDDTIQQFTAQWKLDQIDFQRLKSMGFGLNHPQMKGLQSAISEEKKFLLNAAENYKETLKVNIRNMESALPKLRESMARKKQQFLKSNGMAGVTGIEKGMEAILRDVPAIEGKSQPAVALTLDARFQRISENALRDAKIGRGAAVVLDVNTGDILAMASVPDFDPNQLVTGITPDRWQTMSTDPTAPFVSRALSAYPPGSIFKLVTALAAGKSGNGKRAFNCSGSVTYDDREFRCWTVKQGVAPHGSLRLADALKSSCNCFFYQLGNAVGISDISDMAGRFDLGQGERLGLDFLFANDSFIPTEEWWAKENKGPWTSAKTANVAIGRGEVKATPLEMAGVAAAVANGGKIWQNRLVSRKRANGQWQAPEPVLKHDLIAEGVPPELITTIREGMWKTVNDASGATGKAANSSIGIAGKTGTAQKWRIISDGESPDRKGEQVSDNHAWFIGFAPYEKPRYAFAILVGNGKSGGGTCAPIAKRIMEQIAEVDGNRLEVDLSPLTVAQGNFDAVGIVQFPQ